MTVGELRDRMSGQEFIAWSIYFGREAQRREMAEKKAGG